jgi:hypothetical protein
VICHNLLHDLTEGGGLAIFACGRKVDRGQGERLCGLRDVCCETRSSRCSPSGGDGLGNGNWRRGQGWECLLRVGINGGKVLRLRDCGRDDLRRERIWGTFQVVQSLERGSQRELREDRERNTASVAASMTSNTSDQ